MRKSTRTALAGVPLSLVLLLAGACSDDDGEDAATTTTEATTTSSETTAPPETPTTATTAPPSSETTVPPETDTTAPATEPAEDGSQAGDPLPEYGEDWASELIRAWGRGDRERAAELADPDALDALFGYMDPGGDDWDLESCDGAAGTTYCTFSSASLAQTVTTQQSAPNGAPLPIRQVDISA